MIKFKANDEWYKLASSQEKQSSFSSGGRFFFNSDKSTKIAQEESPTRINNHQKTMIGEGFSTLLRMLRLNAKLRYEDLAKKINVNPDELRMLEKSIGHTAEPRTLVALAKFFKIPTQNFLQIGGVLKKINAQIEREITRFAAESESFDQLTKKEKELLQGIVKILGED